MVLCCCVDYEEVLANHVCIVSSIDANWKCVDTCKDRMQSNVCVVKPGITLHKVKKKPKKLKSNKCKWNLEKNKTDFISTLIDGVISIIYFKCNISDLFCCFVVVNSN